MFVILKDKQEKVSVGKFLRGMRHAFHFYECRGGDANANLTYTMTWSGQSMDKLVS